MRKLLLLLFVFCLLQPLIAQQNNIREVPTFSDLRNHVQDVSRTRFVKGYFEQGDGGHGLFVLTNTVANTNLGTRIQVTGKNYSWERIRGSEINVRWFGAKGNDVQDDTTRIQAAINFASIGTDSFTNTLGLKVYIPEGFYRISSALTLSPGMVIYGDGRWRTQIHNISTTADTFYFPGTPINGVANPITITDMHLFGMDTATAGAGIYLDGTTSQITAIVKNIQIYGHYHGLRLLQLHTSTFENVYSLRATGNGFNIGPSMTSTVFSSCFAHASTLDGWWINNIHYCHFNSSAADASVTGSGYYLTNVSGTTFTACGSEENALDGWTAVNCDRLIWHSPYVACKQTAGGSRSAIRIDGGDDFHINRMRADVGGGTQTGEALDLVNTVSGSYPSRVEGNGDQFVLWGTDIFCNRPDLLTWYNKEATPSVQIGLGRFMFVDDRVGLTYNPQNLAGNFTQNIGLQINPSLLTSRDDNYIIAIGGSFATNTFGSASGVYIYNEPKTGGAVVTNYAGIKIDEMAVGAQWNAAMLINQSPANLNTNYSIYNASAYPSFFAQGINIGGTDAFIPGRGIVLGPGNIRVLSGTGTPESVITAPVGSLWLRTDGVAGTIIYEKATGTGNIGWIPVDGAGLVYIHDPTQFGISGLNVWLTNGLLTTNIVLKGAVTSPTLNVSGVNIDAATGTEFSKELASNTSMGIINMTNDQTIHITFTNTTFTLSFTNTDITWLSSVVPVINTNAVNVYHFTKKGGRIFASDPEQVANANLSALSTVSGTGVLVKTNANTIVAFDPLPVRYGGTGTNTFASIGDGNIAFHNLTQNALETDDAHFQYSKSLHTLFLARTVPTGAYQLAIFEGSGVVPVLQLYPNMMEVSNDALTLKTTAGSNVLVKIASTTALEVSSEFSTIIGDGTTTTSRTNKFLYLPSTAGIPTGVPHTETGTFPIVWDSSNNHLYLYDSGWNLLDGSGITGLANPNNSIGLSVINGTATTAMRSDAAPPLSQAIAPTWSALHTWLGTDASMLRFHSTAATNAGANLSVPFRFQDADLNFYEAAKINIAKPTTWDGTAAARDGLFQVYVTIDNVSKNLFQLYSFANSGLPVAWFPELSTDLIYGNQSVLATTATRGFLYLTTCAGTPTGIPLFSGAGSVPLVFDTTNNKLYAYDSGWIDVTGAGGASANWVALGTTNAQLYGDAYVNKITSTNGFATGSGLYTSISASLFNSGGEVTVVNNSATRLSKLSLKGGTGAESWLQLYGGTVMGAQLDTNQLFQANALQSTNGITPLDVAPSKLIRTASNNKIAAVTIGAGLTFDGTTLDIAGGGTVSGTGTPTYYSQWTGAAALGDGGLYHIDSTAVGLGSTNFFLHTHGGINNLGLGEYALAQVAGGGTANTAIGRNSQAGTTTGDNNVSVGEGSLQVVSIGDKNVAIGNGTLAQATANGNSMIGYRAGNAISTSTNNSGGGYLALNFTTNGKFNSAWGAQAGFDNLTGDYNTYLGADAGYFDGGGALTYTNTTQIGFQALATNDNAVVLGNQNVNRWQLGSGGPTFLKGTSTPEAAVQGNVGDVFIRTDGATGTTMYWKETGSGNTGWVSKGSTSAEVTRLHIESGKLPASNPAQFNPVSDYLWELLFDPTTSESAGYSFIMPQGYGSALKVRFKTTVKAVQTGTKNIVYRFSVAAMKATEDPTNPTFATANSVTVTLGNNQAANAIVESTVNLTNADSVVAGDLVLLKVDRNAADGSDDATGDSALIGSLAVEWLKQ